MFRRLLTAFVDARAKSVVAQILRDYGDMLNEETKQKLRETYARHNK